MRAVYLDTSFLVSLYTPDANSTAASSRMQHLSGAAVLTALGEAELTNALELRIFRKELSAREARLAYHAFQDDLAHAAFSLLPMPAAAYEKVKSLARHYTAKWGVRTLDILHVATAIVLETEAFWTFDTRQKQLAKAEGFGI